MFLIGQTSDAGHDWYNLNMDRMSLQLLLSETPACTSTFLCKGVPGMKMLSVSLVITILLTHTFWNVPGKMAFYPFTFFVHDYTYFGS